MEITDPRAIIDNYNNLLFDIYQREGLQALSDHEYTYKGIPVMALSNPAIVRAGQAGLYKRLQQVFTEINTELSDKSYYYAETELLSLSGEIKYRIGTLYLYHPYILQLKYSYRHYNGKKHFVYDQTLEDARFNREIPIAFESIYKYWQRISDYLSSFFPEVILKLRGKTYFHLPFEHICSKYPHLMNSQNLKWLVDFSKNEYPKFNRRRQFFVHQKGYDNEFFGKFLDRSSDDESVVVQMDEERDNLLVYLKAQLEHCLDGYLYLMAFLNELDIQPETDGGFLYNCRAHHLLPFDAVPDPFI